MNSYRDSVVALCAAVIGAGVVLAAQRLPIEPPKGFGTSITAAFEGWFDNPDGSGRSFLVGYYNRNLQRDIDIPVGDDNKIEPGGPDQGQPTHFLRGRRTGVFIVPVPKSFTKPEESLVWTLTVNGVTTQIPLRTLNDYNVSPFTDLAVGNKPPIVRFEEAGAQIQGPIGRITTAPARAVKVGVGLQLPVWTEDDAKYTSGTNAPMTRERSPVTLFWSKYRGPGDVTFDKDEPKLDVLEGGKVNEPFRGKAVTTATFSEAGDYVLELLANDYSGEGGGGEVCCWTNAMIKVSVTP
jgi:hypothetical protein